MNLLLNLYNFRFSKNIINGRILIILLLFSSSLFAQLNEFQLLVTPTNETCSGNGTLTFTINNGTSGTAISYTVYKQPDLTNPISISSSDMVSGLTEGTYVVIATQSLGQLSNTDEVEVIIIKEILPFAFDVDATNQTCIDGGGIIITPTEGTVTQYEIISGPITMPPQDSNTFNNLPAGIYVIRVYNECGDAEVTTFELVTSNSPPVISEPQYDSTTMGDCNSVTVTNTISYGPGIAINYPITVEYTLTPSNGNPPTTLIQTYESGDEVELSLTQTFPTDDSDYTYSITITDDCNSQFVKTDMILKPEISLNYEPNVILPCGEHYLTLLVQNFSPPFTVNFIEAPENFNPQIYNAIDPGPFDVGNVVYGSDLQPVPEGNYEVEVTDNCGKKASVIFGIENEKPEAIAAATNNGCFAILGRITVSVPDRKIVSAIIEVAPSAYTIMHILPENVSNKINSNGVVILTNMPLGEYWIRIVDECGVEYFLPVVVPDFELRGFTSSAMSSCIIGSGALRVGSGNGKLVSLTMTDAPDEFNETLPFDVTPYIDANGILFMDDMPVGNYSFSGTDICGIEGSTDVSIIPPTPPENAVVFTRNCGTFNVTLADGPTENFDDPPTYWLQKRIDEVNGIWGHPETGIAYTEGTLPTINNSMLLVNGETLLNLGYEGMFRVIKHFESYISPSNIKACLGNLSTFEFYEEIQIKSVYNIACFQNSNDVYIYAVGSEPMHYSIKTKDGEPFIFDNGTNPIFSGLAPGVYEFLVEDACFALKTRLVDVNLLPELTNANDPGDMLLCVEPNGTLVGEFDLSSQNLLILGSQPADLYTITYHTSFEDAENGVDAIPILRNNLSNPEHIFARLVHKHIPLCYDITSFNLRVSEYPVLEMQQDYILCKDENEIRIYADAGFNSYEWSTGETTPSIAVSQPGNYWVKVGNNYDGMICETTAHINVRLSGPPDTWYIETADWTDFNNSITIHTKGQGDYEYSIDGENYQPTPYFSNLKTGVYTVYIRDINKCGSVTEKVSLLNYPKFFTPNGDGINEKWRLEYSWFEPEVLIYIFDRYGKLITSFTPLDSGWDGTFNGKALPATDYWFVVIRKSGKVHKGHFSMIR